MNETKRVFLYIVDKPFVRKGPRSQTASELFCVVTGVSRWILVEPFLRNKKRVRESGYDLKAGVHMLRGLG